jgi:hypothetical protein
MANAFRGRRQRRFTIEDFLLKFGPRKKATPADLDAKLMLWAKAHNRAEALNRKSKDG